MRWSAKLRDGRAIVDAESVSEVGDELNIRLNRGRLTGPHDRADVKSAMASEQLRGRSNGGQPQEVRRRTQGPRSDRHDRSGELSLEDSIEAFERGVGLVRSLNHKLDEVERRVEVLIRGAQGDLKTTPYDPAAAKAESGHHENDAKKDDHKKDDEDIPF